MKLSLIFFVIVWPVDHESALVCKSSSFIIKRIRMRNLCPWVCVCQCVCLKPDSNPCSCCYLLRWTSKCSPHLNPGFFLPTRAQGGSRDILHPASYWPLEAPRANPFPFLRVCVCSRNPSALSLLRPLPEGPCSSNPLLLALCYQNSGGRETRST